MSPLRPQGARALPSGRLVPSEGGRTKPGATRHPPTTIMKFHVSETKRTDVSPRLRRVLPFLRGRSGAAAVEFAVVLPVLLLFVFGILDFGRALNYDNDATHLANEGARFAAVNTNPGGGSLASWIKSQGDTSEMRGDSTVCVSFPTNIVTGTSMQVGDPVQVTVAVNFPWVPYLKRFLGASTTMTGKAIMRLEQPPTFSASCA
jgi:Flp pilus assembly protein TadG